MNLGSSGTCLFKLGLVVLLLCAQLDFCLKRQTMETEKLGSEVTTLHEHSEVPPVIQVSSHITEF